jgi:serine/threonine-protein kinase
MAPIVFGKYELRSRIGGGGMADVFKAELLGSPRANRDVAVKRLKPEASRNPAFVELFITEATLTRQLEHPNIIAVFDAGEMDGSYYIVMDYVEGRDLGFIMAECKKREILLPVDFACFVAFTIAAALDYAHNAKGEDGLPLGIIHCDVSPGNVFISHLGEIYLGDFGIAQSGVADPRVSIGLVGKAGYMSPEQIEGRTLTPATDVFACGAILYELLTNHRPFGQGHHQEIWERILSGRFKRPKKIRPEIPEALDTLVAQAISPRLDKASQAGAVKFLRDLTSRHHSRVPSAKELAERLEPLYDAHIGTPLAIASVVRGLFGAPKRSELG